MKTRLRLLRKELKLTQVELSNALGARDSLVGMWESGARPIPALRVEQICNKYNVNREWLETGVGEMFLPVVSEDTATAQRRFIGEIFDSLPVDKQRIILDALRSAFAQYLDDKKPAPASNSVNITAPVGGAVTIDQKIEHK